MLLIESKFLSVAFHLVEFKQELIRYFSLKNNKRSSLMNCENHAIFSFNKFGISLYQNISVIKKRGSLILNIDLVRINIR